MTKRDELIELIGRLIAVPPTVEEDRAIANGINELSSDPEWSNYIFYSKDFLDSAGGISLGKLVDKILEYKPIII